MHSHSFQDAELTLHRYVNDSPGQVAARIGGCKGLPGTGRVVVDDSTRYPIGHRNKGLITQKT